MIRFLLPLSVLSALLTAADAERPKITGLPGISVYSKDQQKSLAYYRDFLGFAQPYRFGGTWAFKINDRQFLYLSPEQEPESDRLAWLGIETDNAERMRAYLSAHGVSVPDRVASDWSGDLGFEFQDPEGHRIRVVQYRARSRIVRDKGKHLSPSAISHRMMHAGIIVTNLGPAMEFYTGVLGFREFWRGSSNGKELSWINLKVPDGEDYIELMLYRTAPAATARGGAHHLCLEVPSVPSAAPVLENRKHSAGYTRALEVRVGRNRRRQLNLFDPDGTRAELMEPGTIDGVPPEPSSAPPP